MDRFTEENYESFAAYDGREEDRDGDDGPSVHQIAVRLGMVLACPPEAECASCMSTRKTVQRDREIRAAAVCCEVKGVA